MEMKRAYMREKPVCNRVPVIAMPVCPKARCHVKLVKGHRGRGVPWEACQVEQGPRGQGGGWEGGVPEPGGGMSEAAGDRGRGVVDGCIPSMRVGCTF